MAADPLGSGCLDDRPPAHPCPACTGGGDDARGSGSAAGRRDRERGRDAARQLPAQPKPAGDADRLAAGEPRRARASRRGTGALRLLARHQPDPRGALAGCRAPAVGTDAARCRAAHQRHRRDRGRARAAQAGGHPAAPPPHQPVPPRAAAHPAERRAGTLDRGRARRLLAPLGADRGRAQRAAMREIPGLAEAGASAAARLAVRGGGVAGDRRRPLGAAMLHPRRVLPRAGASERARPDRGGASPRPAARLGGRRPHLRRAAVPAQRQPRHASLQAARRGADRGAALPPGHAGLRPRHRLDAGAGALHARGRRRRGGLHRECAGRRDALGGPCSAPRARRGVDARPDDRLRVRHQDP